MSNRILKRKVLRIQVRFTAPLCVSSGEEKWTDSDVLKDADGRPFVAGSSVAGAMRAYLEKEKDSPCMMGYYACSSFANDKKLRKKRLDRTCSSGT